MTDHEYYSPQQIADCNRYPFTLGQIRHLLEHRNQNGLNSSIVKIGKRIYFRKDLFEVWINSHLEKIK